MKDGPRGRPLDEAVAWLLGSGVDTCVDEEGRPLAEQASPLYDATARQEEKLTFGDARDATSLPCNLAALAQVHRAWPDLLGALSGLDATEEDSTGRALQRVSAGVRLAPLVALREGRPATVYEAALYKLSLGFGDVCAALLLEERVDADDPTPPVETLDALLDTGGWLIGRTQVCAGSRAQIRRAWRALALSAPQAAGVPPSPLVAALHATWFQEALGALLELEALAAAAAGAAREALLDGRGEPLHAGTASASAGLGGALFRAARAPLWVEALRAVPAAGAAHASLLYPSAKVPESLREFITSAAGAPSATRDAALVHAAREPAARLGRALALADQRPLTEAAFLRSCTPDASSGAPPRTA
ncbi:MAG: hypothetical protein R3B40_06490 [Polyangiales bacterium]|nr:hypothetical protein [Myxococcales bacterium]MCB9657579.1 hypothetical protein [Sandaracinaceae bacterium]